MEKNGGTGSSALAHPEFRRYYLGAVAGVNATWMFRVLLSWAAWDMTRSPSFVGIVAATSLLPIAITGPFFGALADRLPILDIFRHVSMALLGCAVLLLGFSYVGWLTPLTLLVIATLYGIASSAHHPVRQSLAPRLVGPDHIGSVVALAALNFNVARMLSPAIGGVLIGQFGVTVVALLSAILFLPNLFIAPTLHPRERVKSGKPKNFYADLIEGVRIGWSRWPVRRSLLMAVVALGPIRAMSELLALIADGTFERGVEGLGLLSSAVGGGALMAALFQVFASARLLRIRGLRLTVVAIGLFAAAAMALVHTFALAIGAAMIVGFSSTYVGVSLQIGLQAQLEDEFRGRIMSLWMLASTLSTSLIVVLISAVSELFGLGATALWAMLIAACFVGVIILWRDDD